MSLGREEQNLFICTLANELDIIMYIDRDEKGNISIMEIGREEAKDFASLLFEFEHLTSRYSLLPEREALRLREQSIKIRGQIVNMLRQ